MKKKQLWINQIKGLCICLVVIYHSVITFYPHLTTLGPGFNLYLAKLWVYLNLYLAPFRMPVFFFISGYLITRYIHEVRWRDSVDKRLWSIFYVLVLWGMIQWVALTHLNQWLAPDLDRNPTSNAAYADTFWQFAASMAKASTSLWYLYALLVYFVIFKALRRYRMPVLILLMAVNIAITFMPLPWWGLNSVVRNMIYYGLGAWFGPLLMAWMKDFRFSRHPFTCAGVTCGAMALYLVNVPLVISLVSIVVILRVFYLLDSWRETGANSFLNVVGSNTIAIYTTHRILIEAMSLIMIARINNGSFSGPLVLAILLVYPFISLAICTLAGLGFRKLSVALFGDMFFSPPAKIAASS